MARVGKARYVLGRRTILAAHVLHSSDDLAYRGEGYEAGDTLITSYGNSYAWLTLRTELHPGLMVRTVASAGKVDHRRRGHLLDESIQRPEYVARDVEELRFVGLRSDWELEASDRVVFEAGAALQREWTDYDYLSENFEYAYTSTPDGDRVELAGIDSVRTPLAVAGTRIGSFATGRLRVARPRAAASDLVGFERGLHGVTVTGGGLEGQDAAG